MVCPADTAACRALRSRPIPSLGVWGGGRGARVGYGSADGIGGLLLTGILARLPARGHDFPLRIGRDSQWDTAYQLMKYECLGQWVIVSAFATEASSGVVGAEGHYLIARADRQGVYSNPSPRQSLFNHLNHASL